MVTSKDACLGSGPGDASVRAQFDVDILGVGVIRILLAAMQDKNYVLDWVETRHGWTVFHFDVTGSAEAIRVATDAINAWQANRQM